MKKPHTPQTLRIIGGQWRGRKLPFANLEGLRPTPDRVRETLFNWLQGPIQCARCLDLYAGSGALGLEALSRGANHVLMADTQQQVIRQLQQNCQTLSCNLATFHSGSALQLLEMGTSQPYNIAFIDPPYRKGLVEPTCRLLEQKQWLTDGALIYLEVEQELKALPIPENWELLKSKKAGQVSYHLLKRHAPTKEST